MRHTARQTRENRTITVDLQNAATYAQLLGDGKAVGECGLALLFALGFQLTPKAPGQGGGGRTRHAPALRVRLGGVTIWRLPCPTCRAVCTVLPHCLGRYRPRPPEVAREARLAPHGGRSVERGAVLSHLAPMALSRLVCACGHHRLVMVVTRCGLPLPVSCRADAKPSKGLADHVDLPTMGRGRVRGQLGATPEASAVAFPQSDQEVQRAALQQEPTSRVRGILTAGFDSPTERRRTRLPGARRGSCLRHALHQLPGNRTALASPVRKALRAQCHTLVSRARQRKSLRGVALGQRVRHGADHVTHKAGVANGERVRRWVPEKKAGWYAVLAAPQMVLSSC